ncbi:MAG: TIGR00725 family protein [Candidatus Omnitrophica bacterium]|nr:TIGR00725 family protein [Candidatus Omnitrophota bacterium]
MRTQKITISVIGGHRPNPKVERLSYKVGKIIAEMGCVTVCGGLSGVMEAVAKGAHEAGGMTIGLLPGKDKTDANPYINIALPTTIGYARNAMVVCSADLVVAMPGSYGTQSEICYALVYGRLVLDFGQWNFPNTVKIKSIKDFETKLKKYVQELRAGKCLNSPKLKPSVEI